MVVSGGEKDLFGHFERVYLGRAVDERIRKQKTGSGGAVTALLMYLLEKREVDAIIAAKRIKGLKGDIVIAHNKEELLKAAGNRWDVIPFASSLRRKIEKEDLRSFAIVCLPCQAQFLSQMRDFPLLDTDFGERIKFIFSLFCVGTFAFETFLDYLRIRHNLEPEEIEEIFLKGDHLEIKCEDKKINIPLKEAQAYLQKGCLVCADYTGVWSDISAGVVKEEPNWTLLISRNRRADELILKAREEGVIELRDGSHCIESVIKMAKEKLARAQEYFEYFL